MSDTQSNPKQFSITYPPGLYRVRFDISAESFAAITAGQGLALFHLRGAEIHSKLAFIHSLAQAGQFPDYAQSNWDALEECLRDLKWCPAAGYVIFYQGVHPFQAAAPEDYATAIDILAAAVEFWQNADRPLYVFLE